MKFDKNMQNQPKTAKSLKTLILPNLLWEIMLITVKYTKLTMPALQGG